MAVGAADAGAAKGSDGTDDVAACAANGPGVAIARFGSAAKIGAEDPPRRRLETAAPKIPDYDWVSVAVWPLACRE
jgi:hypothetical protein